MLSKQIQVKGILAKFLEQGIKILLIKECEKISNIKIDIISSSFQIIKGEIQRISIIAEDINYKYLLFDQIELDANQVKINFKYRNKELDFKNNLKINFKISLSEKSLKKILFSNNWNWIKILISKEILNGNKLEDIKIKNSKLFIKASKEKKTNNQEEKVNIFPESGKIHLKNETNKNSIQIPMEDKVSINNISIEDNLVLISGTSFISF